MHLVMMGTLAHEKYYVVGVSEQENSYLLEVNWKKADSFAR